MYLDYNATAPYSPKVIDFLENKASSFWQNASSEYALSRPLDDDISAIRRDIAAFLDCSPKEILFTSGATESTNLVLSRENLESLGVETIITSRLEHHATLDKCKFLESLGLNVLYVENSDDGIYDLNHLEKLLDENKKSLVSLLYVNNETGVINDAVKISELVKTHGGFLHLDAVQALGKVEHSLFDIDPHFVSYSGHKVGSLKGVGILFVSSQIKFCSPLKGGGQELGLRPGTYNYLGIKSLGLAISDINLSRLTELQELRAEFEKSLVSLSSLISINGNHAPRVFNTINVYLGMNDSREVLLYLSSKDIQVSTGSACTSGSVEPSHVIQAMGKSREYAQKCLRISYSREISQNDFKYFIEELKTALSL